MSGINGPQDRDAEEGIMPAGEPPYVFIVPAVERRAGEAEARFNEGKPGESSPQKLQATADNARAFEAEVDGICAKIQAEATNGDK